MKKLLAALMTILFSAVLIAGCGKTEGGDKLEGGENTEAIDISIAGLKGPTSMGMVKLMEDAEKGKASNNYTFSMAGSADEITPKLVQGELDIAAVPANLASVLYNNTKGEIQLLAVNTLGVVYIVERGEAIQSIKDLKGKTIYATGKGSIPEYALKHILEKNDIDPEKDITIEWKSEPTEVVSILGEDEKAIAMLPQPFVTVAQNTLDNLRIAVNLTESWDALDNGSQLITGVLVVRKAFAEENPKQLEAFLKEYEASTKYVNENVDEASALVEKFNIVKAPIAKKAIPYCNITYLQGEKMKSAVEGFLEILYNQNPKAIGGSLPGDDFYYGK